MTSKKPYLPKVLVFASGSKDGGGSGFRELLENAKVGVLQADIIGVVSNHGRGGVWKIAEEYGVPFKYFAGPFNADRCSEVVWELGPDFVALSGWIKPILGIHPEIMFNIHPGPLPEFGGKGMYGHYVHEALMHAYHSGEVTRSAVTMHFVTEKYDEGPKFFEYPVLIRDCDTSETLAARVNKVEHGWQSFITNLVVHKQIKLVEGHVVVPDWYKQMPYCPAELK